jgi:hypothetical protein
MSRKIMSHIQKMQNVPAETTPPRNRKEKKKEKGYQSGMTR